MGIQYHPGLGEALWCDYTGIEPEMCKRRLVVVLTPKAAQRYKLVTVVPISATCPEELRPWHVRLSRDPYPQGTAPALWVKCDMVSTVSFDRLSGYHYRWEGKRKYMKMQVAAQELVAIREGVLHALGLHGWVPPRSICTVPATAG